MVSNASDYPGVGSPLKNVAPTVAKIKSKTKSGSKIILQYGTVPNVVSGTVPGPVSLPVVTPLGEVGVAAAAASAAVPPPPPKLSKKKKNIEKMSLGTAVSEPKPISPDSTMEQKIKKDLENYDRIYAEELQKKLKFMQQNPQPTVPQFSNKTYWKKQSKVNKSVPVPGPEGGSLFSEKDFSFSALGSIAANYWYRAMWVVFVSFLLVYFVEPSPVFVVSSFVISISIWHKLRENCRNVADAFSMFFKGVWELFIKCFLKDELPTACKTVTEIADERKDFAKNDEFHDKGVITHANNQEAGASQFNYKVKIRVNDDSFVVAEIDTDSHICLINEEYFQKLAEEGNIEYLPEPPVSFNGLASTVVSKYSPVMLNIQIGRSIFRNRFAVTDTLKSSPVLLGTDFLIKNNISVSPYNKDEWFVTIGPLNDPISKVPAFITNKIIFSTSENMKFAPFETKRISVEANIFGFEKELFKENGCHKSLFKNPDVENFSPFRIVDELRGEDGAILVENRSPCIAVLPAGMDLAASNLDLTVYKVHPLPSKINACENIMDGNDGAVHCTDELENMLEPGFSSSTIIDKENELEFVRQHSKIPERFKKEFIKFLDERSELFSGDEFSSKHFPKAKYQHDVELIDENTHSMSSRPFPCSGIRLQQLKADIDDLVKNGVLSPGDSPFTSPIFYVLKKAGEGKTASKGRLCFDYRKINSLIKNKNFPLATCKNFFDRASQFKYFCIIDIQNAFLSIALTERARQYLGIITPFGVYLPNRTPFGLKSSPSAFCYALSQVLGDLNFCNFYMDDIHVGGRTEEEMFENLKIVMDRLYENNLKIRLSKTKFFENKCKLLGLIFSPVGKQVDPAKVAAIQNFGPIDTIKKVQCFLGMLAFLSSFIPHFSTACAPLYSLLKNQKTQPFVLTEEAITAYQAIKDYISQTTLLYHVNLNEPLYLSTDASNVGAGAFLYQIYAYEKNEKGKNKMLDDLGYIIDEKPGQGATAHMLPGVSPGKNTPVVTDFLDDTEKLKKFDKLGTLDQTMTMTEKVKYIEENYILHVRPISFFSKSFSKSQTLGYATMEKEFLSLMLAVANYRDYMMAAPLTYILTDSQPVCWALRHKEENLKLSRWILKLWEYNINFVVTHVSGNKNSVADFLSRLYFVPELKEKDSLSSKMGMHINSPFCPFSVLSKENVLKGFSAEAVSPCAEPALCHLNVNKYLFKNVENSENKYNCMEKDIMVNKVLSEENFCFSPKSLEKHLVLPNIIEKQREDEKLKKIFEALSNGELVGKYFLKNGVICKNTNKNSEAVVTPRAIVPFLIASYHFQTHAGPQKLLSLIQLNYTWGGMLNDIDEFCKGCVLCSIFKSSTIGQNEIGTPRIVTEPAKYWQVDVCSGLVGVKGSKSFLTMVDLYTGFVIPVQLKAETSEEIAKVIEENLIKTFGAPREISSDNAANLTGPAVKKLCAFYNISYRNTVPYSPTSHALVEIANRYVTQLLRIFSDQYQSHWPNVLTLAAMIYNSVPRIQLNNHSPFYLMFLREPFSAETNVEKNLNLPEYVKQSINDRIFAKLLRERLLKIREKRNKLKNRKYFSYPVGSVILVRDLRPKVHKKLKPLYFKSPQKIVTEYRCTVYASDVFGRIRKHSKNNIKLASKRSEFLFSKLPDEIKLVLGDEFSEETWETIKDTGVLPAYLADLEIESEQPRLLRSNVPIPDDTHLIEQTLPTVTISPDDQVYDEIEEENETLERLLADDGIRMLNELHDRNVLQDDNLQLKDVEKLYNGLDVLRKNVVPDVIRDLDDDFVDVEAAVETEPVERLIRDPAAVDPSNILPENSRRRRAVRFSLP